MLGLVAIITLLLALTAAADARTYSFKLKDTRYWYPQFKAPCPEGDQPPASAMVTKPLPSQALRLLSYKPVVGQTIRGDHDLDEPSVYITAAEAGGGQITWTAAPINVNTDACFYDITWSTQFNAAATFVGRYRLAPRRIVRNLLASRYYPLYGQLEEAGYTRVSCTRLRCRTVMVAGDREYFGRFRIRRLSLGIRVRGRIRRVDTYCAIVLHGGSRCVKVTPIRRTYRWRSEFL